MVSLILPTYNESLNIKALLDVLDAVLRDIPHEIIIVDDDSPDETWKVAESLSAAHPTLRVLRRVGRRGLSSAVVEGFDMASGDILAVMDADGQHDSGLLLRLVDALEKGADMVIGSRYMAGGSVGDWVTDRRILSNLGTLLSNKVSRVKVSDPLGGFFAMKKTLYRTVRPSLRPTGFKILLEILAHVPASTRVQEVPLVFRMRLHGHSKLSFGVQMAFLWQVLRLTAFRVVSGACTLCTALFWVTAFIIAVVLLPRAWHLRLLTNADIRGVVHTAIRDTADHHGWLLSDIDITDVHTDSVTIRHQQHLRVPSPITLCTVTLSTSSSSCVPSEQ